MTPLNHARNLISRGFAPIPVPFKQKRAVLKGWPDLRLTEESLNAHFNGDSLNIGVLLGEPSGWQVDIDLDHPLAVKLAAEFLPHTGAKWGRASKPASHWIFRASRPVKSRKWKRLATKGKADAMIVELRSSRLQSLAPGSTHPSGESVRWDVEAEPALIDPDVLIAAVDALARRVRKELGEEAPDAVKSKPPSPSSAPRVGFEGSSNYGREGLRREAAAVADAPQGIRNDTLNVAAFKMGTLVGGGELGQAEAEATLLSAALLSGLSEVEARGTIASGMRGGMAHPRCRPTGKGAILTTSQLCVSPLDCDPVSASQLIRQFPDLRPVVIDGLLREGEVMNVVAPPKIGKSWLIHMLAGSLISGAPWLNMATTPGTVLLIDGELHKETLAFRLRALRDKLHISTDAMDKLSLFAVRGKRWTVDHVADVVARFPPSALRVILIDALYRFFPPEAEENANETMTKIYNTLDGIADSSGAAIVVVHHATKGAQGDKAVTDVGAGAGSQSRAADTHLVLRQHEEDDHVVVDAAVRSFAPLSPFVIRCLKPGWALAPDLDPTKLKKGGRRRNGEGNEKSPRQPINIWTPKKFALEVVGSTPSIRAEIIARALERNISKVEAEDLLKRAEAAGEVHRHMQGPCAAHMFSALPPTTKPRASGGGPRTPPPPGADAPGGVGGPATPLPPSSKGKKKTGGRP